MPVLTPVLTLLIQAPMHPVQLHPPDKAPSIELFTPKRD